MTTPQIRNLFIYTHQSAVLAKDLTQRMRTVRDIMSPVVCTIPRTTLVCEVEGIFVAKQISGAPIVDNAGKIVGIITKSDIVRFDFTGGDPAEAAAWEIASPSVITVPPSCTLKSAAQLMLDKHIHRLLVTNDGEMVGLVSALDFVRLVAQENV
ncbi:MAG: CBS domain-containing protein [Gammaproteobacteria bacterium]|nr:CBS domain-containing protein [Gammaproteobacteria bacterium]